MAAVYPGRLAQGVVLMLCRAIVRLEDIQYITC